MSAITTTIPNRLSVESLREFPKAPRIVDEIRQAHGKHWPEWCFCPLYYVALLATGYRDQKIAKGENVALTDEEIYKSQKLALAVSWRLSQDIITFQEDFLQEVLKTPFTGKLPVEVLYRLPAWTLYFDTPLDEEIQGFFVTLEHNPISSVHKNGLMFSFIRKQDLFALPSFLFLNEGNTLEESMEYLFDMSKKHVYNNCPKDMTKDEHQELEGMLSKGAGYALAVVKKAVSLILYVCSEEPEYSPQQDGLKHPVKVLPKKVKKGWRTFPAQKPRIWVIGEETGKKIKAVVSSSKNSKEGAETKTSVRPHLRRGHWHLYWTGKRKWGEGEVEVPQKPLVKWVAPTYINISEV